jgi:myo-inositol-1(or 4)-monophosphatase
VPAPEELLPVALEAVRRAGEIVRSRAPGTVTAKGDRDPATEVDYAVERAVREFLLVEAPEIGFLGEEDGRFGADDAELVWALDPVDGTVNFMHGVPLCAVSLGLVRGDRSVLGVIELPFLGMRYSAVDGRGAHRDGERIAAAQDADRLADAVVALGDYAVGADAGRKNAERLRTTELLAASVQRIRMFGSAAVDLTWVAEGRIAASVMQTNLPWDTAAGVVVAREAGAVVVDQDGKPHTTRSSSTVAVAPALVDELLELLGHRHG